MAQLKSRINLNEAEFPLLYSWAARTVVQPTQDGQNSAALQTPQILYCQDVLPTQQGCKSVRYKDLVAAADPANLNFIQVFTVRDTSQNKALIGVTLDSAIYMLTEDAPTWVDVTPASWAGADAVTVGVANGVSYLYLANNGCYLVDIATVALTLTALAGITAANILGMTSALNYLILWDATGTVYWSSTIDPLDFVPSLITGAGSSIPTDLAGLIVIIIPLGTGFVIYTTQNIVLASFSNNTQFPWVFRRAPSGSGIDSYKKVSLSHNLTYHVALTFAGALQVTMQGCTVIVPEVTDFLAARVYEAYNFSTDKIDSTALVTNLATRITVLGARWIVLSYGITASSGTVQSYTDCLVYDSALKRWGKLHITHACIFEIETNMEGVIGAYNEASELGLSYAAASPETYGSSAISLNQAPQMGRIFGVLQNSGAVLIALMDYDSHEGTAVLVLGKYQAVRSHLLELQGIEVESIATSNDNFALLVTSSLNGKDLAAARTPTELTRGELMRTYAIRAIGKNHLLTAIGSFDFSTIEITAVLGSRR